MRSQTAPPLPPAERPRRVRRSHRDRVPLPPMSGMGGTEFRRRRECRGWSVRQLAEALGRSEGALRNWEHDRRTIPLAVARWLDRLPAPPQGTEPYSPTPEGLRAWLDEQHGHGVWLQQATGANQTSIHRWARGARPLPLGLRVWLRAGAPPDWAWAPPGTPNRLGWTRPRVDE